ncbi:MAG TPA: rhodanese-like domain-containing protein [Methanocella sp.]|nr:rhodanese-like domain-containing protein [Methanocella sp.]
MATEQIKFIGVQHLKRMAEGGEPFILLDVRSREDYAKEHIKGAKSLPLDELDRAKQLFKPGDPIITYCDSFVCSASSSAAKILSRMGFTNVRDFKGGLREWKMNDLPTESS